MSEKRQNAPRRAPRVNEPLDFPVFWRGKSGRHEAFICDVGEGGCYLNTSTEADTGERIVIEIPNRPKDGESLDFDAVVVPQDRTHIGFGAKFEPLTEEQGSLLSFFMARSPEIDDRKK